MRHLPNILSAFRIVLIPFFVAAMLAGNILSAAVILVISGITDLLDGFLARRFGWVSQLGKVLDPAADKLTQVTVCILLAVNLRKYWFFFAFLLIKELVMLILGGYLLRKGIKLEGARWFGKVMTVLFYVVMCALLFFPGLPQGVVFALLAVVAVSALVAALLYIPDFRKYRSGELGAAEEGRNK